MNKSVFAFLCVLVLFVSCQPEPPRLIDVHTERMWIRDLDRSEIYQALSVFAFAEDRDGLDDIESLFLVADDESLVWRIEGNDLERIEARDETRIGASSIVGPDTEFPGGSYRVIVQDRAGLSAETRLILEAWGEAPDEGLFPGLDLNNTSLELFTDSDGAMLRFVDAEGAVFHSSILAPGEYQMRDIVPQLEVIRAPGVTIWVTALSRRGEPLLLSGPYRFSESLSSP